MWTPLRIVGGVVLLVPMINGMALAQVLVLWITLGGVGLANAVWDQAVDQFSKAALYTEPPPAQGPSTGRGDAGVQRVRADRERYPRAGTDAYRVTFQAETTSVGTVTERAARWSSDDLGEAVCGGLRCGNRPRGSTFARAWPGSIG